MRSDEIKNGIMDLDDLHKPFFRRTLDELEDLLAQDASRYLHPGKRWEYPWALQRARLVSGEQVLDAGCGASIFPVFLARRACRVTAIDSDLPARMHAPVDPDLHYVRADLNALPFKADVFDAVFCISVIEHLAHAHMHAALSEMTRVLKPGGRLLLTTDFAQDAREPMRYEGPGPSFEVDWQVFDRDRLQWLLDGLHGLRMEGELTLDVDWKRVRPLMRRFHGYPYTSAAIAFRKP